MHLAVRRLLPALIALALAVTLAPAPVHAAQPSSAEARMLSLINGARRDMGRVPLRWDARLHDIARYRSEDMARKNYFAHLSKEEMARRLDTKRIVWYRWGETIARNNHSTASDSADAAFRGWRNSSGHWSLLTSTDFNYLAIGLARSSSGMFYWTALLLKGPDRTAPVARMTSSRLGSKSGGKRSVTVYWTGYDVPLSVLTSGLRDFRLQRRIGSGSWATITDWTTATSRSMWLDVGKTYRFRVRARDRAGNVSTWSAALKVVP